MMNHFTEEQLAEFRRFKLKAPVRALKQIVEEDIEPISDALPCTPGWVHANPGDIGVVEHIDGDGSVTVRFTESGTATLILDGEIEEV